jgi:hypothetical protein
VKVRFIPFGRVFARSSLTNSQFLPSGKLAFRLR